jgi:hypothetical protein
MQQPWISAAPLHGYVEGFQRQMAIVDGGEHPADDKARIQVEDGNQIQLGAPTDHELRRVADPPLIWALGV